MIWNGKFDPFNLYKLYGDPIINGGEETDVVLSISEGKLLSKKPARKLKDYGTDSRIWSTSFLNYISIMTSFFGTTHPGLHRVLMEFFQRITRLERIYEWSIAILPLALVFH